MAWILAANSKHHARFELHLKYTGGQFGPVDVVKYAEAFGANGYMVNSPQEIGPVLRMAFEVPGPVLIGIRVDYRDNHLLFDKTHEHLLI